MTDAEILVYSWSNGGFNTLELSVPSSKKKGAKYYSDETIRSLVDGQFRGTGKMRAEFDRSNLDAILKRLDELGVTVTEEFKDETSDNNSENSLSRNAEIEDSEEKDVHLEQRAMTSYTDKKGVYHEGIRENLRQIESALSREEEGVAEDTEGSGAVSARRPYPRGLSEQNALRREAASSSDD